MSVCISSRLFENQPNEICSHLSEKASKGMFPKPEKLQNHSNEGKLRKGEKEKKKSNGCTLNFYNSYLEIVFGQKNCSTQKVHLAIKLQKNPARYVYIFFSGK